jgi:hypothetical protein
MKPEPWTPEFSMHDNGVVLSAAWDQCVRVWDLRVRQEGHGFVAALTLPSAPLSIESSGNEVSNPESKTVQHKA